MWAHDNWYSLGLREKLPYPQDAVRVGFIHYNTADEIDGFVARARAARGFTGASFPVARRLHSGVDPRAEQCGSATKI